MSKSAGTPVRISLVRNLPHAWTRLTPAALCFAVALVASSGPAHAQDLFDVGTGAVVTSHSALQNGEVAEELIGEIPDTGPEQGSLIFADSGEAGTVHFVEFQTPEPVALGRIQLHAVGDSCSTDRRTLNAFRLLADDGAGMQEILNVNIAVPYSYLLSCNNALILSAGVPMTVADTFRAEFTQARTATFDGPRVIELNGFGPATCGDVNLDGNITATDALSGLRAAVGSQFCDSCICDVNDDGSRTATDALNILQHAIGLSVDLDCPVCGAEGGS